MTKATVRCTGLGMSVAAALVLVAIHGTVLPSAAGASECCQLCDARITACYAACDSNNPHDASADDSSAACWDSCDEEVDTCFRYCVYCQTPPTSPCYHYDQYHTYWSNQYGVIYKTEHFFLWYETSSGFCP